MTGPGPEIASVAEAKLAALADRDVAAWPEMPARLLHVLAPGLGLDFERLGMLGDVLGVVSPGDVREADEH